MLVYFFIAVMWSGVHSTGSVRTAGRLNSCGRRFLTVRSLLLSYGIRLKNGIVRQEPKRDLESVFENAMKPRPSDCSSPPDATQSPFRHAARGGTVFRALDVPKSSLAQARLRGFEQRA
jgi:hypothetical protein